jgi:hypothetical protein
MAQPQDDGQVLSRESTRDDAYPGGAYTAVLLVDGGDIQLRRRCSIVNIERFCVGLEAIYSSLSGAVELSTLDDIAVSLSGDGYGYVRVDVNAGDVIATTYRLKLGFGIDQSYLPPFIRSLRATFPSKVAS